MFFDNLESLCRKKNTTISAVAQSLGLSKGSITSWRNGVTPNGETLLKFANFFDVSTDFLLTGKEKYHHLDDTELFWLDLYEQLSLCNPKIKDECIGFVQGYIARGNIE